MKKFLVVFCIIMCLGGAVNSGSSGFLAALPFVALLFLLCWPYGNKWRIGTLAFVSFCIVISLTQYHNPLLYPILFRGTVSVPDDGYITETCFHREGDIVNGQILKADTFDSYHGQMIRVRKGEKIAVTGVENISSATWLNGDSFRLFTTVGSLHSFCVSQSPQDGSSNLIVNKPIESAWAKMLGNLMWYPLRPLLLVFK